ncbi:hypothetical protein AB6A40_007410 [Gnathostoma spinigerum]|uniref:Golgi apparatus protein 1 n=1 Tax=Gnathostoma spinigerum TaxID=75299 RepID=A0ABD6EN48_9BILA
MQHAQARDEKDRLGSECSQALAKAVKVADIGSNYKVDRVLYGSCRTLIDGPCAKDAESEASTLACLLDHIDAGPQMMPPECEQRLLEVQYFMARDWTLDPDLYHACHHEAVSRCSAPNAWHLQNDPQNRPESGPQVLACLYRSAYDEQSPLSHACRVQVVRVLQQRAVRVSLLPDLEENCRGALSQYCSNNVKPMEELNCLQEHFQETEFINRWAQCAKEVAKFTKMQAEDTKLNALLVRACKPVIQTYCAQYANEEIDHGDVLECLVKNKFKPEMNKHCHAYVNHFELVSLRDYTYSYKLKEACEADIEANCQGHGNDKGVIIRCLSLVMFKHKLLDGQKGISKKCEAEVKAAFLEQEQFDDKDHMEDADPVLMKECRSELTTFKCRNQDTFADVVECLRVHFDELGQGCRSVLFDREKIQAMDNTFDDELMQECDADIERYCGGQQGEQVLDCLSNTKILRLLSKQCQKVVVERMHEQARDIRLNPQLFEACKSETEKYCPDDFKKLNDPRFERKVLQGVVVSCLRMRFIEDHQGGEVHLNAKCKDEISKVILESEFDVELDPPLYHACRAIIPQHCAHSVITLGGDYYSVLECLKEDYKKGVISDINCKREIARRLQEALFDIHLDPILHGACATDVQRLCFNVPPGQSRIVICLLDALKREENQLSTVCRARLKERHELWTRAHTEQKMPLPESFSDLMNVLSSHPRGSSIIMWFLAAVLILFLFGCLCGRATKRMRQELKNR